MKGFVLIFVAILFNTILICSPEKPVKNSESPLGFVYRLGVVGRQCPALVEDHSQVFDVRRPWHFLAVKCNSSARKSPRRPASSEINYLCFRSFHLYLLSSIVRSNPQTFMDTNMVVSSANVASSHPSAVGASEVNKLYKVGDKTAGTRYGILQTDDLDLPTLTWKVRSLRKECMIRARKPP
jgi:hypothetical protein